MTRSNDKKQPGELMKDWRRLNVAITRAKLKIIIFGSKKTLINAKTFSNFFELIDSRSWIYSLPKDSHLKHPTISFDNCCPNHE
jgi:DNA replication ATP-dependent helicase Dna2